MKKIRKMVNVLATGVVLSSMLAVSPTAHAVTYSSILNNPKAEIPNTNTEISNKYAFEARFIPGKTEITTFGTSKWVWTTQNYNQALDQYSIQVPADNLKSNIGVIYHNVGTYKGRQVNLKITLLDWVGYVAGYKVISFGIDQISMTSSGYDSVKQKWEYVYADDGKKVDMPGSFMNVADIDYWQGVKFDAATTNKIEKMYVSNNSWIQYSDSDGQLEIVAPFKTSSQNEDDFAMTTILFNDSEITFDWRNYNAAMGLSPNFQYDPSFGGASSFIFLGTKPARTETTVPTKLVTDKNEERVENNSLDTVLENYNYEIYHFVPEEMQEFYYNAYTLEDTLIDELEIVGDITVLNDQGEDVTNYFNNETVGNKIKLTATPDALGSADFYGHTYTYQFSVRLKDGADLTAYKVNNGYSLPNVAKVAVDGKEKNSNSTKTLVPFLVKGSATKTLDSAKEINPGDPASYSLDFTIPNDKEITTLSLRDDLEDALDLKDNVKVMDGNKDVTDQGTIMLDKDGESVQWDAENPNDFVGANLTMKINATLKYGFDESAYKAANGTMEIPNVGSMSIDDKETQTNKVVITPKIIKNKAEKFVEAGGKDSKELKDLQPGEKVDYRLDFTVGNNQSIDKLSFSDDLEDVFDLGTVKVFSDDKDVTDQGDLKIDSEKESLVWTPNNPQDFAGKKVSIKTDATLKYGFDESAYKAANDTNGIPNVGSMTVNDEEINTDQVVVTPKIVKDKAEKFVEADGEDSKELKGLQPSEKVDYRLDFTVGNNQSIDKLSFSDDLEDVFDLGAVKVFVGEKDVTNQGELKINDKKESLVWTPNNPQDFAGKKVSIKTDATLKYGFDESAYKAANGTNEVPNVGSMTVNDKETKTDQVVVVPNVINNKAEKFIEDGGKDSKELQLQPGKKVDYRLDFTVGNNQSIDKLSFSDDLEDVFDLGTVKVFSDDKDVTDQGDLKIDNEKESLVWTPNNLKDFIGKKVSIKADATLKYGFDESAYKAADGTNEVPNVGSMKINDKEEIKTDKVAILPNIINNKAEKFIEDDGEDLKELPKVKPGDEVDYRLDFIINNNQIIDKLSFSDDLEDVLDLKDAKVLVDDKDVTDQGDLKIDNEKEILIWTPNNPQDFAGKKVSIKLTSKLKEIDLAKYKKGSEFSIPNTGKMQIKAKDSNNEAKINTNEVNITSPIAQVKNEISKITNKSVEPKVKGDSKLVQTGSENKLGLFTILGVIMLAALGGLIYTRRKRKN